MDIRSLLDESHLIGRNRLLLLGFITVVTLGANLLGLLSGFTVVFAHLLYFPVILAGYWYPRQGIPYSICVGLIYGTMFFVLSPSDPLLAVTAISRMAILIIIGGVVGLLSLRLRESEQQLHQIIEFLPDATFAIDNEGRVIAWNRAIEEMTGVKKAQILYRGNYEYAVPFYKERRLVLADLILKEDVESAAKYPYIENEGNKIISEVFIPHFRGGRGAHLFFSATALIDADGKVTGAIESIRDVTDEVMTESALQNTSRQLNTLAGIIRNDLSKKLAVMYGHLRIGVIKFNDPEVISFINDIMDSANGIRRQIEISREFRDIGTSPPGWMPVQNAVVESAGRLEFKNVRMRTWVERLEIFADPHIPTVFYHLFDNSLKESTGATMVLVSYHVTDQGCSIIIEDNGTGIPESGKELLFTQSSESYGRGLFLSSEILAITGIDIRETGVPGEGARFEIIIPSEGYRIRMADHDLEQPVPGFSGYTGDVPAVRELKAGEFPQADTVWFDYHETKGDPEPDRIFGVFLGSRVVSLARCRRHPDGLEVDGVFTPEEFRSRGYSHMAMDALVDACHNDDLYMFAVRSLTGFYNKYGFEPVGERDLPPSIRKRYSWAGGNMEGADVQPMLRKAGWQWN